MNLNEVTMLWDEHVRDWMNGEAQSDSRLLSWRETYRGEADGAIDPDAMPEPWIGDPKAAPGIVLMGLNPGRVTKAFQHRGGTFPQEIDLLHAGSWASWARSSPYAREPWETKVGRNAYWSSATSFVQAWAGRPIPDAGTVCFELYPWHSRNWQTNRFQIDEGIVREFILDPIASVPPIEWALGKGKSWWTTLERLATLPGWTHVGYLGGPDADPCPSGNAHRRWLIVRAPTGLNIAAMRLTSMPVWPKPAVVPRILQALTAIANQRNPP
jgi:hypothetical protein